MRHPQCVTIRPDGNVFLLVLFWSCYKYQTGQDGVYWMHMTQAYVWDHVVWLEMKVSGNSDRFFENKDKSMEFY